MYGASREPSGTRDSDMSKEFLLESGLVYLNHAAVSPWPRRTARAVEAFAEENSRVGAFFYPRWMEKEQRLRERLRWLVNAPDAKDIALLKNTSEALSMVAYGLPWSEGDNIVSITQEFPSNRIVWESLKAYGVEVRLLDLYASDDPEGDLIALCDRHTRLVSVSSVQYARGLRLDIERIGAFCHPKDILFCVDAIQHLGALPFDVQACQADFVAADGHKWMLGPEGLALFYVRPEVQDRLQLKQYGWHMVEHAGDFDRIDWRPARDARRFECGSPNMLAIHALEASLSLLEEMGMETVTSHIAENRETVLEHARSRGYRILSPDVPHRLAGIVTFSVPGVSAESLHRKLMENRVVCASRGGGIRFSPHFHNTASDIERAFGILDNILK